MSNNWYIRKQTAVHLHNGILLLIRETTQQVKEAKKQRGKYNMIPFI